MPRRTDTLSVEEVQARFEAWRQNRKGKASIPDELWATAVEVASAKVIRLVFDEPRARGALGSLLSPRM